MAILLSDVDVALIYAYAPAVLTIVSFGLNGSSIIEYAIFLCALLSGAVIPCRVTVGLDLAALMITSD